MKQVLQSPAFKTGVKLLLVVVLFYFLTQKGLVSLDRTKAAFSRWDLLVPAYFLLACTSFLSLLRWYLLLRAQGLTLTFSRTAELGMVGFFFNIALPGAVTGDVIKAIYVSREVDGNRRAHSFSSILFDRVAGVSGLILVSFAALALSYFYPLNLSSTEVTKFASIQFVVGMCGLTILAFYIYLFFVKENFDPLLKVMRWAEEKMPRLGSILRVYEGIRTYNSERRSVYLALGISCLIHITVITAYTLFSRAMGEYQLPVLGLYIVVPLALIFTAVPLTPAGAGTGNAVLFMLLQMLGSERGADIFNLFLIYHFTLGLTGGLVYLRFRKTEPTLEVSDMNSPIPNGSH